MPVSELRRKTKRVLIFCPAEDCPLKEFLEHHPSGLEYIFEAQVPYRLSDLIITRDPDLVLIHVNDGLADWPQVVSRISELSPAPVAVVVPSLPEVDSFTDKVDLVTVTPSTFEARIRFISTMFNLAHGVGPSDAIKTVDRDARGIRKSLLRLIQWVLVIAILLSTFAAALTMLVRGNPTEAAVTFGTIFSSTIAAFTSIGGVRLLQYYMRLHKTGLKDL